MADLGVLAQIPGLAGYLQTKQTNEAQTAQNINNAFSQMGMLSQIRERMAAQEKAKNDLARQEQWRAKVSALGPNASHDDMIRLAIGSGDMTASQLGTLAQGAQDKVLQRSATRETAMARLAQQARLAEDQFQYRMAALQNPADRLAETIRHNKVIEGINADATTIMGKKYELAVNAEAFKQRNAAENTNYTTGGVIAPTVRGGGLVTSGQPANNQTQRRTEYRYFTGGQPIPTEEIQSAETAYNAAAAGGQVSIPGRNIHSGALEQLNTTLNQSQNVSPYSRDYTYDPATIDENNQVNAQNNPTQQLGRDVRLLDTRVPASGLPPLPVSPDQQARDAMLLGRRDPVTSAPVTSEPAPVATGAMPKGFIPEMPPEVAAMPRKEQNKWLLQQTKPSIAGGGTLTPQALSFVAKQYLTGDRQAISGFARSQTQKIALTNAIVDEAARQGLSPEAVSAKIADFAGIVAGSRTVGQRAANISLAATEAKEMINIVKQTSDDFERTNFIPWNYALKAYESNTGTPEVARFGASLNALVNVYARAINPTGVPTVSDKEHARSVINAIQSPDQVDGVLGIINQELDIAIKAPKTVREATRRAITGSVGMSIADTLKQNGEVYEPDKYDYRIGPNGAIQKKAK